MALLDYFTADEIAAELRQLGYTVTPPTAELAERVQVRPARPSWLVEDDDGATMLGRGEDE